MAKNKHKKNASVAGKGGLSNVTIFMAVGLVLAMVFLPTTFLLCAAMLPSLIALITDNTKRKTKAITVGMMNLAGTLPFLLDLWVNEYSFESSFALIMDLKVMIIIYMTAAVGYLIDWSMTGIVSSIQVQRGHSRKKAILGRQKELIQRWGTGVCGNSPLDELDMSEEDAEAQA